MRTKIPLNSQTVGNIGPYFVCHKLSRLGWNVMPTARNARGVDIVAYTQTSRVITIQVKSLSKRNAVALGANLDNLIGDYVVIVGKVKSDEPICYIMTPEEVRKYANSTRKNGIMKHWLQPVDYERFKKDDWPRIGNGIK